MSERPEADPGVEKIVPPVKPPAPTPTPTTAEKPGTGSPQKDPPPPTPTPSWSGSDKYPDGYRMARDPDGNVFLTAPLPDGRTATWDGMEWLDDQGNPMPEGWGSDHVPGNYKIGQGSPRPHSGGISG